MSGSRPHSAASVKEAQAKIKLNRMKTHLKDLLKGEDGGRTGQLPLNVIQKKVWEAGMNLGDSETKRVAQKFTTKDGSIDYNQFLQCLQFKSGSNINARVETPRNGIQKPIYSPRSRSVTPTGRMTPTGRHTPTGRQTPDRSRTPSGGRARTPLQDRPLTPRDGRQTPDRPRSAASMASSNPDWVLDLDKKLGGNRRHHESKPHREHMPDEHSHGLIREKRDYEINRAVDALKKAIMTKSSRLHIVFKNFDQHNMGIIPTNDCKRVIKNYNFGFDDDIIDALLSDLDKNGDGFISYEEFKDKVDEDNQPQPEQYQFGQQSHAIEEKKKERRIYFRQKAADEKAIKGVLGSSELASPFGTAADIGRNEFLLARMVNQKTNRIRDIFRKYDVDRSGALNKEEFLAMAQELNLQLSQKEVEDLLKYMDSDGTGTIDYNEFLEAMKTDGTPMAELMKPKSMRSSGGNPIGWTTETMNKDPVKHRFLYDGVSKLGVMNDNMEKWRNVVLPFKGMLKGAPDNFKAAFGQPEVAPVSAIAEKQKKKNPILAVAGVGEGKKAVDKLPSHKDENHTYGIASHPPEVIGDVLQGAFLRENVQKHIDGGGDYQQSIAKKKPFRRFHTAASMKRQEEVKRMVEARKNFESARPAPGYKMPKFKGVKGSGYTAQQSPRTPRDDQNNDPYAHYQAPANDIQLDFEVVPQ